MIQLSNRILKKLAVVVHVLQTTQNLVISRVVLQRSAKKCTKIYNARAQLLFCSLNLLFSDVPVAVAVVVFLNSLLISRTRPQCVKKCMPKARMERKLYPAWHYWSKEPRQGILIWVSLTTLKITLKLKETWKGNLVYQNKWFYVACGWRAGVSIIRDIDIAKSGPPSHLCSILSKWREFSLPRHPFSLFFALSGGFSLPFAGLILWYVCNLSLLNLLSK